METVTVALVEKEPVVAVSVMVYWLNPWEFSNGVTLVKSIVSVTVTLPPDGTTKVKLLVPVGSDTFGSCWGP